MDTRLAAEQLRALESVADAALSYLPLGELLDELLSRVVEIVDVDTAAILLLEDDGRSLVPHAARGLEGEVEIGVRIPVGAGFAGRIAAERRPLLITAVEDAEILNPVLRGRGLKTLLGVPLVVEGSLIGVLHVGSLHDRQFQDDDIQVLQLAGDRAALAIHGRLTERERGLADAMQRSLMPTLPEFPGIALAGRYLPAASAQLGGDWYDAFPLPGGTLGVAIGDVAGRGFRAAAVMGQLRSGLRAYAMEGRPPDEVLQRLSHLLRQLERGFSATLLYLVIDPLHDSLVLAGAGHPPPLVARGDGECAFLEMRGSVPLGAVRVPRYATVDAELESGDVLVLYTDGVVERSDESLDAGFERLHAAVAPGPRDPQRLCDTILSELLPEGSGQDDAALLVMRSLPIADPFVARLPAEVDTIPLLRRILGRWLQDAGASGAEVEEITLSACEACANVIEHAYAPGRAAMDVRATLSPEGEAVVSVRDSGRWREPRGTNQGRGMVLMNGLMDRVETVIGEEGTTVRLHKRLKAPRGDRPA
jgi:serine phosphatase RsbU (regulator of sigma subunit)/anti-sigma regulatory factor (Ser/Thr protein kinase)